jgi:SAM-dependent methyltransferase
MTKPYDQIVSYCETCLEKYGDSSPGVGWPRGDADTRYRVMLDVISPATAPVTLLDFGCGASHLYEYILMHHPDGIVYSGLDLSDRFLALSRQKFPDVQYYQTDVLDSVAPELPGFDYVIMNGIFNYKGALSSAEMLEYLQLLVRRVFEVARVGIALNVMSKQVEWERDDLFHLAVDPLMSFLSREVSRHIVVRHDYGLYEYTVYVYRLPSAPEQRRAKRLLETSVG